MKPTSPTQAVSAGPRPIATPQARLTPTARLRTLVDIGLTVVGAATIAAMSLVLEDALPLPGDERRLSWMRLLVLGVGAALLITGVALRRRFNTASGTLYYVRYLMPWMYDWTLRQEGGLFGGYLDRRVIFRHCDAKPRGGVLDVATDVCEIRDRLQAAMNEDDITTGYTLAPNMLAPVAVACGYGMYAWPGITLFESFGATSIEWTLLPRTERQGDSQRGARWSAHAEVRTASKVEFNSSVSTANHPVAAPPTSSVLLMVDLTTPVRGSDNRGTVPAGFQPDVIRRLAVYASDADGIECDSLSVRATPVNQTLPAGTVAMHPLIMVEAVRGLIDDALHEFPHAAVYAVFRLPKSVALAVGYALSGPGRQQLQPPGRGAWNAPHCPIPSCGHPWQRLVLLIPDQERSTTDGGNYLALRVHDEQPTGTQLAAQASAHGLVLSRSDQR